MALVKLNRIPKMKPPAKSPDLYFVIGGGINRTKCGSEAEAFAHAQKLFVERSVAAAELLAKNGAGPSNKSDMVLVGMDFGKAEDSTVFHAMTGAATPETPKIERQQCVGNSKPLFIVKVVAVVEQHAAPIRRRKPAGDELADKPAKPKKAKRTRKAK